MNTITIRNVLVLISTVVISVIVGGAAVVVCIGGQQRRDNTKQAQQQQQQQQQHQQQRLLQTIENKNPYSRGCFHTRLPSKFPKPRVCNSEDPVELRGIICTEPQFEYMEIRVGSGNWASGTALSMLTQILLSELLGVPTTSEAAKYNSTRNFYDVDARIDYDKTVRGETVAAASNTSIVDNGNCVPVTRDAATEEEYVSCAHFVPEFWYVCIMM
jgi:type II secretory pathway pseudopilin PulG